MSQTAPTNSDIGNVTKKHTSMKRRCLSFLLFFVFFTGICSSLAFGDVLDNFNSLEGIGYAVSDYASSMKGVDEVGFLKVRSEPNADSVPLDQVKTNNSMLLMSKTSDYLLVRVTGTVGYIPQNAAQVILYEDLFSDERTSYEAGLYQEGKTIQSGLYSWINSSNAENTLVIRLANGTERQYAGLQDDRYTVYLPPEAQVTIPEKSVLHSICKGDHFSNASFNDETVLADGRYLVGFDIEASPYSNYIVRSVSPEKEAFYCTTTFLYDMGDIEERIVKHIETGGEKEIYLFEGDFIELVNCEIVRVTVPG